MKHIAKRGFSLLLVLAMLVSLFTGLTLTANAAQPTSAAEVNYVTSGQYVYNWGKRDTVATFLTTYAESYYTGSYTYENLSELSGSSTATAAAIYNSELGSAIHSLLTSKQTYTTSYDAVKTLFQYSECEESSKTQISSYYSGQSMGSSWGSGWNREHTWPDSKGLNGSDENDVLMLKPTLTSENSTRGNTAYGEGSGYYDPNKNGQSMHGDTARLMLQHLMRWGNTNYFYGTSGVMESRAVLLKWMEEDPVDTWELGRNDAMQNITGVRNIFVDYPELAFILLGAEIPDNYTTPSGNADNTSAYTVTATSNNTSWGTVSVSGKTVTASPANGYYAAGYTVTSGTATVTQNGNTFSVKPESDCTVRINFAAKTAVTVSFSVPSGVSQSSISGYAGEEITLPTPTGTPSDTSREYTFLGWVDTTYNNVTEKPTVLDAGSAYTPTASATLYALYKYTAAGTGGSSTTYTKISAASDLADGATYVLVSSTTNKALSQDVRSNWAYPGGTYTGNSIENPTSTDVWTISAGVISCADGNLYSSGAKAISLSSSTTAWTIELANGVWTIKSGNNVMSYNSSGWRPYSGGFGSDKTFNIYKGGAGGTTYYTTELTACTHTNTTNVAAVAATCTAVGYTAGVYCNDCGSYISGHAEIAMLAHSYNSGTITTPAACTTDGVMTYTCTACGGSYTEVIQAIGHNYDSGVITTPAGCTTNGVLTYTCANCQNTYTESIPATGHNYGAAVSNNDGTHTYTCANCSDEDVCSCVFTSEVTGDTTTYTCTECGYSYQSVASTWIVTFNDCGTTTTANCIDGNTVTLPTVGAGEDDTYTFAGWSLTEVNPEATSANLLTGEYEPHGNVTLYAVYSRSESTSSDVNSFALVTAAANITSGTYVLVVKAAGANTGDYTYYAIKKEANGSGYVSAQAADAFMGTGSAPAKITVADSNIIWTLTKGTSTLTLTDGGTNVLRNSTNSLYYGNGTASSFTAAAAADTNTFTLSPASSKYMGLRTDLALSDGMPRFRCNSSAPNASYYFYLYKSGASGEQLYYTTNPVDVTECDHANAETIAAVPATCTTDGNNEYYYCADCGKYFADAECTEITSVALQTLAALGHDMIAGEAVAATCITDGYTPYTCSRCPETENRDVISALGHDYRCTTTPAGCTTEGANVYTCSRCSDTYSETIAPTGHTWNDGVITTPATASADGVMTYTCTVCGQTKTEPIPAGVTTVYTRATAITSGNAYIMAFHYVNGTTDKWLMLGNVSSGTCTVTEIPAPVSDRISLSEGTTADLWTITAVEGAADGYSLKLGNSYLKGTSSSTSLATSTTAVTWTTVAGQTAGTYWFKVGSRGIGLQSGTTVKNYAVSNATNTGTSYVFDIYLFSNTCAHTNTEVQGAVEATCTTNGYTGDTVCLDCGAVVTEGTVILQGHDYVEVSGTEATCTTAGNIHYECSRCDSVKDETIAAYGHNYAQTAHQDATCTVDGYTTYTCANCQDTYTDTISAFGHAYDAETGVCAHCGDTLASYTVSFTVPAGIDAIAPISAFDGTAITLPIPTGTLLANAQNYVFTGWVTSDVSDATDTEYTEAGEYTVTGDITFKALYSWVGEGSFGDDGVYKLLTENDAADLDTGWMLIIANDGKWQSKTMALADYTSGGNEKFAGQTVTVSNNTITLSASSPVQEFTVIKDADSGNYYLVSNYTDSDNTAYYLTSCTNTANANNITLTANPTAAALWELTYHEDGTAKLTAQGSWTANTVQFNSSNYNGFFSCYGETYYGADSMPSNIYGIRIFASNPIYHYTTAPAQNCEHENTTWTDNGNDTCTCTCDDCGHIVVDGQAHAWTLDAEAEGTVAATCIATGKAGYVCSNCRATKLETTAALGHDYVGTETTAPACNAEGVMTYTCSRCNDTYTEAIPTVDHHFADGTCDMCGASLYVLVTEAPENWEGEYLIAYVNGENAKVFDGKNDAANNYTVGTFYGAAGSESSLICVANPDDYTVIFDPTDGGCRIMNADANWWSYTAAKNGFSVNSDTSFAGTYTVTLDASGNAVIKNAGNYSVKFNTQSSQFRFYGTSIYTTVKLYEKYGTCHHNWVLDTEASAAATCTAAGNNVYVCSLCSETKNETVAALGHDYQYENVSATCVDEGYTLVTCSRCDYADIPDYSITAALGHDFSVLVTDEDHYIAPTCTGEGLAYYQCSRCDAFDTEGTILAATGHNYVNGVCTNCGDTLAAQTYTLMTALNFADAGSVIMVIKYEDSYYALSEDVDGKYLVTKPVTVNNDTITVYDDGTYAILTPETSVNDGTNTGYGFKTSDGNYLHVNSKAVEFASTTANAALAITPAEVWTGEWDSSDNLVMRAVPNAYFLQGKATSKYVSNYIDTYEDTELSVIDDSFYAVPVYFYASDYTQPIDPQPSEHNLYHFEGSPATCTEPGYLEYYTCLDGDCECAGKMYADAYCTVELTNIEIAPLGHDLAWDGEMGDGSHFLVCSRCDYFELQDCDTDGENGCCAVCGYKAPDETIEILSAALVLNGKIDVAYTAKIPAGYTDARMVFTGPNGSETVTDYTVDNGNYVFVYTGVNPQCIGDNISAVLYAMKNSVEESDSVSTYSVRQYCVNKLSDETISAELRTLLSDLLAYGAAAQTFTAYNTEALVNTGADIVNPTYSTYTAISDLAPSFEGTADADTYWTAAGLTLTDSVAMTFRFCAASVDGLTVRIAIDGREETFTEFVSVAGKANTYEVTLTGIKATEFNSTVTARFERSGAAVGNAVSYSVNTYVCAKQADSNAALAALVKALYNYGASAEALAAK